MFHASSKMFEKFFKAKNEPQPPPKEGWEQKLVWLSVGHPENPFKQEILDCRSVALTFTSLTSDKSIAENFNRLRKSNGEELRGQLPEKTIVADCQLQFPYNGQHNDGPISLAREMEDKWDFYTFDNRLYIRRSWTGKLIHVAELEYAEGVVIVRRIHADSSSAFEDAEFAVAQVYFLIATHLGKALLPFPISRSFPRNDVKNIATAGFSSYGRRAQFGSYTKVIGA
jgi:hypothetical protein